MYLKFKNWESLQLMELRSKPLEASRLGRYVLKLVRISNEPERESDSPLHETILEKRPQQDEVVSGYAADLEQLLAAQREERLVLYQRQRDQRRDLHSKYEEELAEHVINRHNIADLRRQHAE